MLIIIIRTVGSTERSSSCNNERDENILQTNKENSRPKKKKSTSEGLLLNWVIGM